MELEFLLTSQSLSSKRNQTVSKNCYGFCSIPLPPWVLEEISKNPDLVYTDRSGRRNPEYLSLGCDMLPVLKGRTPIQVYTDYMRSFRERFNNYLGNIIVVRFLLCNHISYVITLVVHFLLIQHTLKQHQLKTWSVSFRNYNTQAGINWYIFKGGRTWVSWKLKLLINGKREKFKHENHCRLYCHSSLLIENK